MLRYSLLKQIGFKFTDPIEVFNYNGVNYNLIDLDKIHVINVLKKIIIYGIIGSILLSLFAFLYINFKDLMNWDEVYIETVWINIFFIIGLNFYVMLSCFNGCLIFYINHKNNMKKQKINFINLVIIILSIIIEFILLTIYIIICFNSYNNKNCLLWLLYYLFTCVVPTISIIIIINLLKIKLKNKYKNK